MGEEIEVKPEGKSVMVECVVYCVMLVRYVPELSSHVMSRIVLCQGITSSKAIT